ncbi:hypothetical protein ACFKHW_37660 [Bradyrhizobium lupini]|uniref:hypothetical protein n=1 Tax=Rhizobium lupini TaxID=136996 RepID=UPI003671913D
MSIVFDSFANLVKVTVELEHLPQSARDLFGSRLGWSISPFSWEKYEDWGDAGKWLCQWAAIGADVSEETSKSSRVIGRVLLCMDLYRDRKNGVFRTRLAHAEEALLTCVFIAGQKAKDREGYNAEYLKFDANGWPIEPESYVEHVGGRLLEYRDDSQRERTWTERSWMFAVPLEQIDIRARSRHKLRTRSGMYF